MSIIRGYRAHVSRAPQRIWIALLIIVCLIACLSMNMAMPSAPAYAAPDENEQSPISVTITPSSAIVNPEEALTIRAAISNNSADTLSIISAQLRTSRTLLSTHTDLYKWLNSEYTSRLLSTPDDDIPAALQPHSSTVVTFSVSPEERAWETGRYSWGTHGIEVEIEASRADANKEEKNEESAQTEAQLDTQPGAQEISTATQRSVVVAAPSEEVDRFPVSVATICTTSQSDLKNIADPLEALLDQPKTQTASTQISGANLSASGANLSAWDHSGIDLLIDPIAASTALKLTKASAYALPAYNADLSALAHANDSMLIDAIAKQTAHALEAPSHLHDQRFTAFPQGIDAVTLNYTAQHSLGTPIVMSSGLISDERFYFPDASGTITDGTTEQSAIVANELLSMALQGSLPSPDFESSLPLSSETASAAAVAVSAILYNQAPSFHRSLVALISTSCSGTELSDEASALLSAPWLTPTALTQLPAPQENVVWHVDEHTLSAEETTKEIQPSHIKSVQTFIAESSALAAALPRNPDFAESSYTAALRTLDQSWNTIPADRSALIESLNVEKFLYEHIHLQAASHMNIIAEETNIPVRVQSDLAVPISLLPVLNIPDGRLVSSINDSVTIQPSGSTTLKLPIKVRGSGTMVVKASLTLASGKEVTNNVALTMRLHASWETTSTAIAGALIFLVLVIGIVRSIRAGRRSRPVSNEEFTEGLHSRTNYSNVTPPDNGTPRGDVTSLDNVTSPS